jgi:RNA polymerase sigma-70 factor (ECF subfamily)
MDRDLDLFARWRDGDERAGHELFTRHFDEIYRFFEHKVGAGADDLAQRTFLACVTSRDRFRGESTFRTYLFAIARHELLTYLRRLPKAEHVDFDITSMAQLVTSARGKLVRAEELERLRRALAELPVEQQLILELHYWHGLDAGALADVFELEPTAVRMRLSRARQALRTGLEADPAPAPGDDLLSQALRAPES